MVMSSLLFSKHSLGQGIQFTGSDQPIEKRTSATFFADKAPSFRRHFTINFDLQLPNNGTIGYIIRIKEHNENSIYNLYYDQENGHAVFLLNEEGKTNLITMRIPLDKLKEKHWFPIQLHCDLQNEQIRLQIADQPEQSVHASFPSSYSPTIIFGRSEYLIDVPSFALRNFRVGNDEKEIVFQLRESQGDKLHDATGEVRGTLTNGTWLLNNAFQWRKQATMHSSTPAGSAYDARKKSIYYFNRDSLQIYQLQSGEIRTISFLQPCPIRLKLCNSFIDEQEDRLYVYETYYETPYKGPTVASLDLKEFIWRIESSDYPQRELNHHAAYYLEEDRKLLLFGGFGQMTYSNDFCYYMLQSNSWSTPRTATGDPIIPRYFTSIGRSVVNQKLYIFGGMGNEAGQHIVGRKYFYDLYEFDPAANRITKLWELDRKENLFVPARGLVIPDTNWMYMLGYPEHLTHSHIKLRRFSIQDGQQEELGDSIPIYSDKISTNAKLNFDPHLKQLIALVQESNDDIQSTLTVYSIDFPAISESELHAFPGERQRRSILPYVFTLLGVLSVAAAVYIFYKRHQKKQITISHAPIGETKLTAQSWANRVYLFGDFTALDKRGRDISHLFSTRLQQVFCLIMFHSHAAGISSKLLSHLLWPDKPKDKVKTSRGVAINNLRKVLTEIDGIEIIYENGHYRVEFSNIGYCDYWHLKELLRNGADILSPEIATILERGEFLLGIDDSVFDKAKHDLESMLIEAFQESMLKSREQRDWYALFQAANMLLNIDPVNEFALENGLYALNKGNIETRPADFYQRFTEQYKRLIGENYRLSFEEIWQKAT